MKTPMLSPSIPKHKPVFPRVQPFQPSLHARLPQRRALNNPVPQQPSLQHIQAVQIFTPHVNHIYDEHGKKETLDTLLSGKDSTIWMKSLANELGRLAQGCLATGIKGTDTIDFIHPHEVPSNKKVTYGNFICVTIAPSKPRRIVFVALPVVTNSHTMVILARLQHPSWKPSSSSTVQSPMHTKVQNYFVLISRITF
jgi:hypothetical protein